MAFQFSFGFGGLYGYGGSSALNQCVLEATDGTWYGYDSSVPFGTANPDMTNDGTFVYAIKWRADGTILNSFGVAGYEKLKDIDALLIVVGGDAILLQWNDVTNDYRTVNIPMTDYLIGDYELDKKRCFGVFVRPDLFLDYDFEIKVGADES